MEYWKIRQCTIFDMHSISPSASFGGCFTKTMKERRNSRISGIRACNDEMTNHVRFAQHVGTQETHNTNFTLHQGKAKWKDILKNVLWILGCYKENIFSQKHICRTIERVLYLDLQIFLFVSSGSYLVILWITGLQFIFLFSQFIYVLRIVYKSTGFKNIK